jgi:serine/threonine-protein kinase
MTTDDDLAAWGEPPTAAEEQAEADRLADALARLERGEPLTPADDRLVRGLSSVHTLASPLRQEAGLLGDGRGAAAAARVTPVDPPLPDPFPGEYRLRRLLGRGAFGEVWLAEEAALSRLVALKTVRPGGDPARREQRLDALRREAHLLARMRPHPNVVAVHTWRQQGDEHYLVLQYVPGGSLEERLWGGPLPWEEAARYVADVGEGLLHVHGQGVVHRDVKPANILWDPGRDEAVLTDLGIAARLAGPGGVGGTPLYMAPEAFAGRVTPKMDVYSLAATLFRLTTGGYPFLAPAGCQDVSALGAALRAEVERGLPDADPRCADLPERLERLIREGLAADPERRPDLAGFVEALRGGLNQSLADLLAPPPDTGRPAPVRLHLRISREMTPGVYGPVATTVRPVQASRNMKKVPPPEQVALRTGDRVRVEVLADQTGYVTMFNVGPSGDLSLLYPDVPPAPGAAPTVWANQPLNVLDVEMQPPAGRERLFAVWSRRPLALPLAQLHGAVTQGEVPPSAPYRATRNMVKVKQSVVALPPGEWHAVVLEVNHEG